MSVEDNLRVDVQTCENRLISVRSDIGTQLYEAEKSCLKGRTEKESFS